MLNKKFQLAECKSSFADLHEKIKPPERLPVPAASGTVIWNQTFGGVAGAGGVGELAL
jgi:hypothetical protein